MIQRQRQHWTISRTDMKKAGEWNVEQLVRERYGQNAVLIGFTTYSGTVAAASHWGDPPEFKQMRPALSDSYEAVFHQVEPPQFWLDLRQENTAVTGLQEPRLERAIGVIYSPRTERRSHYFRVQLPAQFDAVIHIDDIRGSRADRSFRSPRSCRSPRNISFRSITLLRL